MAIGSNIFDLAEDSENNTPYTIYAASYEKSKTLVEIGLETVAPESKLGFHTDGTIVGGKVYMPHNIMLYNVLVEYKKAGYFYWVPFSSWTEKNKFMRLIGVGRRYLIKVTPSIYDFGDGNIKNITPLEIDAPIFVESERYDFPLYLNGNVFAASDGRLFDPSLIDDLKLSIVRNKIRYAVAQKSRRIIFAKNLFGAHARDIFEEPVEGVPFTRIFMRSVDTTSIDLNSEY